MKLTEKPTANSIIIDTLRRVNTALAADPNALTSTRSGEVSPDAAYIELVRDLVKLSDEI